MAMALSIGRTRHAEQQFSELFRREVGPQLEWLERLRTRQRHRLAVEVLITIAASLSIVLLLVRLESGYATLGGVLAALAGVILVQRTQRGYLNEVRDAVMPALCEAIGDITHGTARAQGLDLDLLEGVGLLPRHDRRQIDDVFEGRYHGLGFTMAEVRLRSRRRGRRAGTRTVFRGLVLAIETPEEIPSRILIAKDAGRLGNWVTGWLTSLRGLHPVAVPHRAFDDRFEVYAREPAQVPETLTPGVCDALLGLADAHENRPVRAAFAGRRFYLAIPKRGDQFRLGSLFRSLGNLEQEAGRVLHDVQLVHRVIDQLHGGRPPLHRRAG